MRRFCGNLALRPKRVLHIERAAHRVDNAAEFNKRPVAGVLNDAPAVLAHPRRDDLAAIGEEAEMGALLVGAHQAGIPDDIGGKNRR